MSLNQRSIYSFLKKARSTIFCSGLLVLAIVILCLPNGLVVTMTTASFSPPTNTMEAGNYLYGVYLYDNNSNLIVSWVRAEPNYESPNVTLAEGTIISSAVIIYVLHEDFVSTDNYTIHSFITPSIIGPYGQTAIFTLTAQTRSDVGGGTVPHTYRVTNTYSISPFELRALGDRLYDVAVSMSIYTENPQAVK